MNALVVPPTPLTSGSWFGIISSASKTVTSALGHHVEDVLTRGMISLTLDPPAALLRQNGTPQIASLTRSKSSLCSSQRLDDQLILIFAREEFRAQWKIV